MAKSSPLGGLIALAALIGLAGAFAGKSQSAPAPAPSPAGGGGTLYPVGYSDPTIQSNVLTTLANTPNLARTVVQLEDPTTGEVVPVSGTVALYTAGFESITPPASVAPSPASRTAQINEAAALLKSEGYSTYLANKIAGQI